MASVGNRLRVGLMYIWKLLKKDLDFVEQKL